MGRAQHSWVDELLNEVQGGFSLSKMAITAGKMILAADCMAQRVIDAVNNNASPRDLRDLGSGLQTVTKSLESYAGIYTWCEQYSVAANDDGSTLGDLIPHLSKAELGQLHTWLARLGDSRAA